MSMQPTYDRRTLLLGGSALLGLAACGPGVAADNPNIATAANEGRYRTAPERTFTDAQWRQKLPGQAYGILRHEDTEYPDTGPFNNERRKGTYSCAGCDLPLFKSEWKFEHDGWPSFFDVIKENIGVKVDRQLLEIRTEYHCARCLGHHGHVFPDGPRPTGLRYCNNGYALKFKPA